jgi:hypothetical protein
VSVQPVCATNARKPFVHVFIGIRDIRGAWLMDQLKDNPFSMMPSSMVRGKYSFKPPIGSKLNFELPYIDLIILSTNKSFTDNTSHDPARALQLLPKY